MRFGINMLSNRPFITTMVSDVVVNWGVARSAYRDCFALPNGRGGSWGKVEHK